MNSFAFCPVVDSFATTAISSTTKPFAAKMSYHGSFKMVGRLPCF
jgi:hypothetical protein